MELRLPIGLSDIQNHRHDSDAAASGMNFKNRLTSASAPAPAPQRESSELLYQGSATSWRAELLEREIILRNKYHLRTIPSMLLARFVCAVLLAKLGPCLASLDQTNRVISSPLSISWAPPVFTYSTPCSSLLPSFSILSHKCICIVLLRVLTRLVLPLRMSCSIRYNAIHRALVSAVSSHHYRVFEFNLIGS